MTSWFSAALSVIDTVQRTFGERVIYISEGSSEYAQGQVIFTGQPGAQVRINTRLKDDDGNSFLTLETRSIPTIGDAEVLVLVRAEKRGAAYNKLPGSSLKTIGIIRGIDQDAQVSLTGLSGGEDSRREIVGSFDDRYVEVNLNAGVDAASSQPMILVKGSDLIGPPSENDLIEIRGSKYRITSIQSDSLGAYKLFLNKKESGA